MRINEAVRPGVSVEVSVVFAGVALVTHAEDVAVDLDHADQVKRFDGATTEIGPRPGDRTTVTIANTCPTWFEYQRIAFRTPVQREAAAATPPNTCDRDIAIKTLAAAGYCDLKSQPLTRVHEAQFGSYVIIATRKAGSPQDIQGLKPTDYEAAVSKVVNDKCTVKDVEGQALAASSHTLRIPESRWALRMLGGLTVSEVVDPRFAGVDAPESETDRPASVVVRDMDAEDSHRLGIAGFLHIHHKRAQISDIRIAATS